MCFLFSNVLTPLYLFSSLCFITTPTFNLFPIKNKRNENVVLFCVRGCLLRGANSVVVLTVLSFSLTDTSSSGGWSPLYGGGTSLDQEAIQYIHKFYCKDCRMEAERAEQEKAAAAASGSGGKGEGESEYPPPPSPQSTLEEMSLQQSMDKNKESKHKYMYIYI